MPSIQVNGLRTYYERAGEGRPLVLIHGSAQDTTSWRFNIPYFAQLYDVVALDLPGHGKSQLPASGPVKSVDGFAAHVWGLVEELGLESPIIMGHSLAGAIALRIGVDHSGSIAGVVDVDGSAYTVARATNYAEGMLDLVSINPTDWLEIMLLTVCGRTTPLERRQEMAFDARRVAPEVGLGDLHAYTGCDFTAELGRIAVPVIVVAGEDDWSCTPELARKTYDLIQSPKSFHVFESVGHIPHTEQPDVFNAKVRDLLVEQGL